jgi:hypothetical protein
MTDFRIDDPPELTLGPDAVFPILLKAREFEAKVEETDPGSASSPTDDNNIDILESAPGDPTYAELISAISDLNDDEQLDLIALIWVGRGDFSMAEWDEARDSARDIGRARTPRYVAEMPLACDYLEDALSQFGYSMEDYSEGR